MFTFWLNGMVSAKDAYCVRTSVIHSTNLFCAYFWTILCRFRYEAYFLRLLFQLASITREQRTGEPVFIENLEGAPRRKHCEVGKSESLSANKLTCNKRNAYLSKIYSYQMREKQDETEFQL